MTTRAKLGFHPLAELPYRPCACHHLQASISSSQALLREKAAFSYSVTEVRGQRLAGASTAVRSYTDVEDTEDMGASREGQREDELFAEVEVRETGSHHCEELNDLGSDLCCRRLLLHFWCGCTESGKGTIVVRQLRTPLGFDHT